MSKPSIEQETLGQMLRRHREAKGLGVRQLAQILDLSPVWISRIERDDLSLPSMSAKTATLLARTIKLRKPEKLRLFQESGKQSLVKPAEWARLVGTATVIEALKATITELEKEKR